MDIPNEVWSQYPLILIGALLVGWVFRYWTQNEREWREFTTKQVTDQESSNLRVLQLIQANNEQLIEKIERNHAEQLRMQREGLREAQDAELERILSTLSVGYYDKRPTPTRRKRRTDDQT